MEVTGTITIRNCINYCTVRSNNDAGGIVGDASSTRGTCTISDCINYGTVISGYRAGGIVGNYSSSGDNTHTRKCQTEGCTVSETGKCSGGKATDTEKAICKVCGGEYGELSSDKPNTVNASKTGDNNSFTLWITMLLISGSAAAVTGRVRRNKYT